MCDKRYLTDDFVYGKEPIGFLCEASRELTPGKERWSSSSRANLAEST